MACPICCDENPANITCSYCHFSACNACTKRYLMESSTIAPKCMGCRKEWSMEFVMEHANDKMWFTAYLAEHLFDIEKRLLPMSQKDANIMLQIRELRKKRQSIPTIKTMQKRRYHDDIIDQKRREKQDIIARITDLQGQCSLISGDAHDTEKEAHKSTYIKPCPANNCRGYINHNFICETCHIQLCMTCHAHKPKDAPHPHACDPNDVLSAREIMSSTRQCPKCLIPIWKISGCNQIFCTSCHCIFDWATGKVDNGVIHNPHFYEWLAANATNNHVAHQVENIACGEVPPPHVFATYANRKTLLFHIYRILNHIQHTIQPDYTINQVKENHDLRVAFLMRDIDEPVFKLKIYNREKRRMKLRALIDLIALEVNILTDIIRTVVYTKTWSLEDIETTFNNLRVFHDQTTENIVKIHGGTIPLHMHTNVLFSKNPFL